MDGDAQKNHNEPSEMPSKQANTGKTRVKKFQGDWCKEFEWLRREGEGPMFCLTGFCLHMCSH